MMATSKGEKDYNQQAHDDAREMMLSFIDTVAEQAREGDVSDDVNNDYPSGDAYHHEYHVDRSYSLTEAATILDELSDDEETDDGLWQGLAPREAISAQAAYTYGNAVYSRWRSLVETLNDDYLAGEDGENRREGWARLFVLLGCNWDSDGPENRTGNSLWRGALDMLRNEGEVSGCLVFADWLEENGERQWLAVDIRKACAIATTKDDEGEEDAQG